MVKEHNRHIDGSLVYSDIITCDENLIEKGVQLQKQIPENSSYLFFQSGTISQFATFKRSFYEKTIGIDAKFRRAVDQDLYLKLEEVGNLKHINKKLYYYRHHKKSISLNENIDKAYSWNILARIDACKRRKISIEDVLPIFIKDSKSIIHFYENSNDYKLGKLLLKPIRLIKKMLGYYI